MPRPRPLVLLLTGLGFAAVPAESRADGGAPGGGLDRVTVTALGSEIVVPVTPGSPVRFAVTDPSGGSDLVVSLEWAPPGDAIGAGGEALALDRVVLEDLGVRGSACATARESGGEAVPVLAGPLLFWGAVRRRAATGRRR